MTGSAINAAVVSGGHTRKIKSGDGLSLDWAGNFGYRY